jgi:hypothetical protein
VTPLTLSFIPTIQYFCYTYFGLNCFNFEIYLGPIVVILVLVWLVIFTRPTSLGLVLVATITLLFNIPYTAILLSLRPNPNFLAQLHLLLAVFLAITLLLPIYTTSYPLFFGGAVSLVIIETSFNLTPQVYSLNIDLVEITTIFKAQPTQSILST